MNLHVFNLGTPKVTDTFLNRRNPIFWKIMLKILAFNTHIFYIDPHRSSLGLNFICKCIYFYATTKENYPAGQSLKLRRWHTSLARPIRTFAKGMSDDDRGKSSSFGRNWA